MSKSADGRETKQNLCQNQVENLLKAMESVDRPACGRDKDPPVTDAGKEPPPEIDEDLLAATRQLHESAACELAETLTTILRTPVEVNVADVATTFHAFAQPHADDHRWRSVLTPEATVGDWYLDVTPELCCVMVDRMLGGDPTEGETFTRPMTEIERRLIGRVVDGTLETIQQAWRQVTEIRWLVRHHDAGTSATVAPRESMLQIRFAVRLCNNQGEIELRLPLETLEALRSQLCDPSSNLSHGAPGTRQRIARNVAGAPVDVVATLARSTIRTGDLLDLNVGDIIATEKGVDQPLELTIHNVPKFKIRVGSLKGNKAIQIDSAIDPSKVDDGSLDQSLVPIKESDS